MFSQGIYHDLLIEFVNHGHDMFVLIPHEKRKRSSDDIYSATELRIFRVPIGNIQKTNILKKTLSMLSIERRFIKVLDEQLADVCFDLIIYSTPPLNFSKIVRHIKLRDGAKSYLLLKDIFPQNAVDLGMFMKNGFIYRHYRRKEIELYQSADWIGCMSKANVQYLLSHNKYLDKERVEICPNSINPVPKSELIRIKDNNLRRKYGIRDNQIVFVYGGNLGKPQDIPFVIECIRACRELDRVHFVIAGSGTQYKTLESFVENDQPNNLTLLPQLPVEEFNKLLLSCDVGLVFLDHRFTIPNMPSRMLSYMQAGIPIFACTDTSTDIREILNNSNFGWWCESNDSSSFYTTICQIINSDLQLKGTNSRKYLEEHYTSEASYSIIMNAISY